MATQIEQSANDEAVEFYFDGNRNTAFTTERAAEDLKTLLVEADELLVRSNRSRRPTIIEVGKKNWVYVRPVITANFTNGISLESEAWN